MGRCIVGWIVAWIVVSPVVARAQATGDNPDTPQTPVPQKGSGPGLTGNWGGVRDQLSKEGISFNAKITTDLSKPFRGERTRTSDFRYLVNANVTVDTEALANWKGGTFFINFQEQRGQNATVNEGLFEDVTNVDANGRTQVSEVWYEQKAWNGVLRVKAGKIDAASEFDTSDVAAEFINGSFGAPPGNPLMPTYPDGAFGADAYVTMNDRVTVGFGVFDGSLARGVQTGSLGPRHLFGAPVAEYYIGEVDLKWSLGAAREGRLQVGGWRTSANLPKFGGGRQAGANGVFAVVDQSVWKLHPEKKDDPRGVGAFVVYDGADPRVFVVAHHLAGGATWTGPIDVRPADVVGAAVTYVIFADRVGVGMRADNELTGEVFYKLQVTPYLAAKADFQWTPRGAFFGAGDGDWDGEGGFGFVIGSTSAFEAREVGGHGVELRR